MASGTVDFRGEARSSKGLIIAFTSTACPVSRQYGPTLIKLVEEARDQGIKVILVNPESTNSRASIEQFCEELPEQVPYIQEENLEIARAIGARSTTEAFLIDPELKIRYRGAIDDQFGLGHALEAPRHLWLKDAVQQLLEEKPISVEVTDAPGCLLDSNPNETIQETTLTYHDRIAEIVQKHCVRCHHEGGLGPFPLDHYGDLVDHMAMIEHVVERKQMPPWFAAPVTSWEHPGWADDRSMPEDDRKDLLNWLASEMPEGVPSKASEPPPYSETTWEIGEPDKIFALESPVEIPAQGKVPYIVRTIETGLDQDAWIQALEVRPTDREVVHHVLVLVLPPKRAKAKADPTETPGAPQNTLFPPGLLMTYVPGKGTLSLEEGYGKKLPKGCRIRFQIHYTPKGRTTSDQLQLGIKFAAQTPKYEVIGYSITNQDIRIPPGVSDHLETVTQDIPTDIELLAAMPHMHFRGKSMTYELIATDGTRKTILNIPHYNFEWQLTYTLAKPIKITKGSKIHVSATYDNSAENEANPDPSQPVTWGPNSEDEMLLSGIEYIVTGPPADLPMPGSKGPMGMLVKFLSAQRVQKLLFRIFDADKNGLISRKELDLLQRFMPELAKRPERLDNFLNLFDLDEDGYLDETEVGLNSKMGGN